MSELPFEPHEALELLADMLRVRRLEEVAAEKYSEQKIRGFLHLYIGEEAIAAAAMRALGPGDNVLCTYREHAQALIRGVAAERIMAEMYGKYEGCSHGRGGSMHLFDASLRFYGGNAIVAGHLPMAVGMALADKLRGREAVTACFFGEGAMAEGAFHESMNLAALWHLPLLLICENNWYAMGTALNISESQTDLCAKAASYKIPAVSVDGMEVEAVSQAVTQAAAQVRAGAGPHFVECKTYRFRAHSMFDAQLYRTKAEVESWKKRDPIALFAARLKGAGLLTDAKLDELVAAADAEIARAVAYAERGGWEPTATLTKDVYTREARHE